MALLRDEVRTRERWSGFSHNILNTKWLKLNPTSDLLPPQPLKLSRGDKQSIDEMKGALEGMPNWKVVGPEGVPGELLKLDHPACTQCFHNILVNVWVREVPQQRKHAIIKVFHTEKDRTDCNNHEGIWLVAQAGKVLIKIVASRLRNYCET